MDKEKICIKKLNDKDPWLFQQLIIIFREVFEMDSHTLTKETYLKQLLGNKDFIALAIFNEKELAGGLTAYALPMYYAEYTELYIYDVAIKPAFQRKGFGKELLLALKEYCRQNKVKEFFVEAHEENNYAVNFYHSAGGKAEKVVHFNFEI